MGDLFETLPPGGIREDDRAQGLAIQRAVLLDDLATELLDDPGIGGLPGHHDLSREEIGIDDARTQMGEHPADRALPGGDAAGEADEEEGPHA